MVKVPPEEWETSHGECQKPHLISCNELSIVLMAVPVSEKFGGKPEERSIVRLRSPSHFVHRAYHQMSMSTPHQTTEVTEEPPCTRRIQHDQRKRSERLGVQAGLQLEVLMCFARHQEPIPNCLESGTDRYSTLETWPTSKMEIKSCHPSKPGHSSTGGSIHCRWVWPRKQLK